MEKLKAADFPQPTPQPQTILTYDEWKDIPYRPNADCARCKGAGFLYAANQYGVDYSKTVPCRSPGCLLDSVRGNQPVQTFETFVAVPGAEKAFRAAKALAYGESEFIWLLIYGPPGNGKTHLANAIIAATRDRGLDVKAVLAADLFALLREAMQSHQTDTLLRKFKDIFLLAIDDYGVEYGSDWEAAKFDELMTSRYATSKPTVLITNKEIADLPDRVRSRFQDKGMSRAIHNSAPDFRATKGKR